MMYAAENQSHNCLYLMNPTDDRLRRVHKRCKRRKCRKCKNIHNDAKMQTTQAKTMRMRVYFCFQIFSSMVFCLRLCHLHSHLKICEARANASARCAQQKGHFLFSCVCVKLHSHLFLLLFRLRLRLLRVNTS